MLKSAVLVLIQHFYWILVTPFPYTFWLFPPSPKFCKIQKSPRKTLKFIKTVFLKSRNSIFGELETLVEYADRTNFSKTPKISILLEFFWRIWQLPRNNHSIYRGHKLDRLKRFSFWPTNVIFGQKTVIFILKISKFYKRCNTKLHKWPKSDPFQS